MVRITRGKEPIHFDDLPIALVHFPCEKDQQFAKRRIRKATGGTAAIGSGEFAPPSEALDMALERDAEACVFMSSVRQRSQHFCKLTVPWWLPSR
jgi:hypothetical protein